ncbi:Protein of unknown function [Cotesia congregata]|uniref:Uncharacterized protein n=1 Tax=Cotesia congregata TaxID=51543 RepID=A0A8J2HBQ7_COTCN|nr:Protein of unknown function [Cotesia congregata]
MDDDRWTKICIKNEMREIMNKNPTKWGKTIEKFLQKIGIGELPKMIYVACSSDDVEEKIKSGLENYKWMLDEKEELYKNIKTEESNNYWKRDNIRSEDKETWARLRCGTEKKGQNNWGCRICEKEQETIIHIIKCKEIHEKITVEGKQAKNKWLEEVINNDVSSELMIETLKGEIKKDLCTFIRDVERVFKEKALNNKNCQGAADIYNVY